MAQQQISTDPPGAKIFIDFLDTGKLSPAAITTTAGFHEFWVRKAGRKDNYSGVNVPSSGIGEFTFFMQPVPSIGDPDTQLRVASASPGDVLQDSSFRVTVGCKQPYPYTVGMTVRVGLAKDGKFIEGAVNLVSLGFQVGSWDDEEITVPVPLTLEPGPYDLRVQETDVVLEIPGWINVLKREEEPPPPTTGFIRGIVSTPGETPETPILLPLVPVAWGGFSAASSMSGQYEIEFNLGGSHALSAALEGFEDYTALIDAVLGQTIVHDISMTPSVAPPEEELPGWWQQFWDALYKLFTKFGWLPTAAITAAIETLYELIFEEPITESAAAEFIVDILGLNSMSKILTGKNLNGSPAGEITGVDWLSFALWVIPLPVARVAKIGTKMAQKLPYRTLKLGYDNIIEAEARILGEGVSSSAFRQFMETMLEKWWSINWGTQLAKLEYLLTSRLPSSQVIKLLAWAMGFATLGTWAAVDNLITLVSMDSRKLLSSYKRGDLTKAEALAQLDGLRGFFDTGKSWIDINNLINPVVRWLTPTFITVADLAEDDIEGIRAEIEAADLEGNGILKITANVAGANVHIDGPFAGIVPYEQEMLVGQYTVLVKKFGFTEDTKTVDVLRDKVNEYHFTIESTEPPPAQEMARITINSTPSEARIYIDDVPTYEKTNTTILREAGSYSLTLKKTGYEDHTESFSVDAEEELTISVTLARVDVPPDEEKARITINSTPVSARIYIDDVYTYEDTNTTILLDAGSYDMALKKIGWLDYTERFTVIAGEQKTINASLSEIIVPPDDLAAVEITSLPPDAKIYLDFEYQFESTPSTISVEPGTYTLTLKKDGYLDASKEVNLISGSYSLEHLELSARPDAPLAVPPEKARIELQSTPPGARIYVDDVYTFETTNTTVLVDPGVHRLTLKLSGYEDAETFVEALSGETYSFNLPLTALAVLPPIEFPPAVTPPPSGVPWQQAPASNIQDIINTLWGIFPRTPFPLPADEIAVRDLIVNIETTGFKPEEKRIISIGYQDPLLPEDPPQILLESDEGMMLKAFFGMFKAGRYNRLIGYGIAFDFKFLIIRGMAYNINMMEFIAASLYDLAQFMAQGKAAFVYKAQSPPKLSDLGQLFFNFPKPFTDTEMIEYYELGQLDKVLEFASGQITRTLLLHYLWTNVSTSFSLNRNPGVDSAEASKAHITPFSMQSALTIPEVLPPTSWKAKCPNDLSVHEVPLDITEFTCPIDGTIIKKGA